MDEELNKCVWMWAGLLTYRLCDRDYQCVGCAVDSLFRSPAGREVSERQTAEPEQLQGFPRAVDRFHDSQHLWLRVLPEGQVQIGLDPMAARLLRSAAEFQLPRVGSHLRRGDEAFRVRIDGGNVSFASPVTGHVVRCHSIAPGRVRSALDRPYSRGWMLVMSVARLEQQISRLSFGCATGPRLVREWGQFQQACIGLAAGSPGGVPALPDGGEIDLERLRHWTGSGYSALVGRWIGNRMLRSARSKASSEQEGTGNPGGASDSPEER